MKSLTIKLMWLIWGTVIVLGFLSLYPLNTSAQNGNINKISGSASASGWTRSGGKIFPTTVTDILTATTSSITGPTSQYVFQVSNTDVEGGGLQVLTDQDEYVYHTFAVGYKTSRIITSWIHNNGDANFSILGTGSTTIGTMPGTQFNKFNVAGGVAIGRTYAGLNNNDPDGLIVEGKGCFGCSDLADTADFFTVNGTSGFTGAVHAYSSLEVDNTLTVSNGAGSYGNILSVGATGLPQWVATSTLAQPIINYAKGSKFGGARFDYWRWPMQLVSVTDLTFSFVATTTYMWPYTALKTETVTGVSIRVTANVAGSSVSCGVYTMSGQGGDLYATSIVAGPWTFESSTLGLKMATTSYNVIEGVTYGQGCFSSSTPGINIPNNTSTQNLLGSDGINMQVGMSTTTGTGNPLVNLQALPDPFPANAIVRSVAIPTFKIQ